MAATKQLREENGELREEITQLKEKLDKISPGLKVASQKGTTTFDQTKSNKFLSNQHDDFVKFTKMAMKDIREITMKIDKIEKKCYLITQAVNDMESFSY
jgi:prefoldin subunit 5